MEAGRGSGWLLSFSGQEMEVRAVSGCGGGENRQEWNSGCSRSGLGNEEDFF